MRRNLTLFLLLFASISAFSQNNWDLIWTLDEKPFLEGQTGSEMSIVKAGFDSDQDGWGEFLCSWTDLEVNYTLMYEASADNTYDLVWYWEHPLLTNTFGGIEVGDFDQNGKPEIIITLPSQINAENPNPKRIWFFEWSGVVGENLYGKGELGAIQPTKSWNFDLDDNIDFRPYSVTLEDIDKDGDNELIVGVRQGDRGREVIVFSITGGELFGFGAFKIEFNHQEFLWGSLYSVTTGDLDNDGNQEIYALIWADMTIRYFECTGPDQYELVVSMDSVSAGIDVGAVDGIRVADANNDGVNELYHAGTESENQLYMVTNISDLSQMTEDDIIPFYSIPVKGQGKFRSMQITDHDKDGNINLMIAGERNGQIFDLEYNGTGEPSDSASWNLTVMFDVYNYSGFLPEADSTITPRFFYGSPADDMDNDGKAEYVFINYSADFSYWPEDKHVWILESDMVVGVENPRDIIQSKFNLGQNYPNPFNPSTIIEYDVAEAGNVEIIVYDVLGNEIQTLYNDRIEAGNYKLKFDGSKLSSGVYYYTLKSNGNLITKKMILLK